jgi:hypothetical protein
LSFCSLAAKTALKHSVEMLWRAGPPRSYFSASVPFDSFDCTPILRIKCKCFGGQARQVRSRQAVMWFGSAPRFAPNNGGYAGQAPQVEKKTLTFYLGPFVYGHPSVSICVNQCLN